MTFATDLAALYAADDGLAVAATVGATTAQVHFEQADVTGLGDDRIVTAYVMRCIAADFPTLARGDAVTIAATTYTVIDVRRSEFGDELTVRLSKN